MQPFRLWLLWFIAVLVGQTANVVFNFPGLNLLGTHPVGLFILALLGAFGGALAGLAQWAALRKEIQHARGWILATALGGAITSVIGGLVFSRSLYGLYYWPFVSMPISGFLISLGQWFVLRQQVARAGWWILIQTFSAMAVAMLAVSLYFPIDPQRETSDLLIQFFIGLGVYGALTGVGLVFVLAQPKPAPPDSATEPVAQTP